MKQTIDNICFWKNSYDAEKEKDELTDSFDRCRTCEGYDKDCKNYFHPDYSKLRDKAEQISK